MVAHRLLKKRTGKIGVPPGTLVHIGESRSGQPQRTVLRYCAEECVELGDLPLAEVRAGLAAGSVTWVHLDGLHDVAQIEELGSLFGLHPLVLEDILNTDHRPKFETGDDHLFLVAKDLAWDTSRGEIVSRQISLVVGRNYVLSFQEVPQPLFEKVRQRIVTNQGRARRMGADYLAYRLLDTVIDHYFTVLEQLGEQIEDLEEHLVMRPDRSLLHRLHQHKREMILLRRAVWPLREVIAGLQRDDSGLVGPAVAPFLRDLYDHTIQIVDTIETFRDLLTGMLDLYLSSVSNRMNEIMKVLTIISTLFIPLTFLVGVYGMNFDHLPELHWRYGYFILWGVMLAIVGGLFVFFRRKDWL